MVASSGSRQIARFSKLFSLRIAIKPQVRERSSAAHATWGKNVSRAILLLIIIYESVDMKIPWQTWKQRTFAYSVAGLGMGRGMKHIEAWWLGGWECLAEEEEQQQQHDDLLPKHVSFLTKYFYLLKPFYRSVTKSKSLFVCGISWYVPQFHHETHLNQWTTVALHSPRVVLQY